MNADYLKIISNIGLFQPLNEPQSHQVLGRMKERRLNTGERLYEQGQPGDSMVVVLDGILRVEVIDTAGNSQTVATIQAGESVGEMSVLDPAPRSASVIAASDVVLLELSRSAFDDLNNAAPDVSSKVVSSIITDVTRRLRKVNQRIEVELDPTVDSHGHSTTKTTLGDSGGNEDSGWFRRMWKNLVG